MNAWHGWKQGLAALGVAALASGCVTTTSSSRRHADFPKRQARGMRVAILPLDAQIVRVTISGENEAMDEVQERLCEKMPPAIAARLEERGYEVSLQACDPSFFDERADLERELGRMRQACREAMERMYASGTYVPEAEAFNCRATLGPGVNVFADALDVDALLFLCCGGYKKSAGEKAKDITTSVLITTASLGLLGASPAPSAHLNLEAVLVDGNTGEVLWAHHGFKKGEFEEQGLDMLLTYLFDPLPPLEARTASVE